MMARRSRRDCDEDWRPGRESNSGARICSPLRHHSATRPPRERGSANRSVPRRARNSGRGGGGRWAGDCARVERGPISRRVFSSPIPRRPNLHERRLRRPARRPWSTARCAPPTSPTIAIQDAMRTVPREALLPPRQGLSGLRRRRGGLRARPLAAEAARRRQAAAGAAARSAGERALAIAAPYAAAVLEAMGLTVTRLDGEDLTAARRRLRRGDLRGRGRRDPAGLAGGAGRPGARLGVVAALGPVGPGACSTCAPTAASAGATSSTAARRSWRASSPGARSPSSLRLPARPRPASERRSDRVSETGQLRARRSPQAAVTH